MAIEIGKPTELTVVIKTNAHGLMVNNNKHLVDEFLRQNPSGFFELTIRTIKGHTDKNLYARYFAGIVSPTRLLLRSAGEIKTKQQTHEWLKELNPEMRMPDGSLKSLSKDCCQQDVFNHVHFCLQYVAENLGVALDM